MESKHTPGPWETSVGAGNWWSICAPGGGDMIADLSDSGFGCDVDAANANRIVQCVNACEGIDDPAAALAAARRLIDQCSKGAGFTDENGHRLDMNVAYIALRDALGKG